MVGGSSVRWPGVVDEVDEQRQQQVEHRPRDDDRVALPERLGGQRARAVDGRDRLARILAEQAHVAAERHQRQPVLGLAAREAEEARPEAEREAQHLARRTASRTRSARARARGSARPSSDQRPRPPRAAGSRARAPPTRRAVGRRRAATRPSRQSAASIAASSGAVVVAILRRDRHRRQIRRRRARELRPLLVGDEVDLVQHQQARRLRQAEVGEDRLDRRDLLLARRDRRRRRRAAAGRPRPAPRAWRGTPAPDRAADRG